MVKWLILCPPGVMRMKTCCLCSALASPTTRPVWDIPVLESSNFVVLPSLGSLLEGWLLLVPREHYVSMGALPVAIAPEMEEMKAQLGEQVRSRFGEVCVFEHGPAFASRKVGCSVDHAHLHIVHAFISPTYSCIVSSTF